jgi:hypothetical protein
MDPTNEPQPTHIYINASSASQNATLLKEGTAANGKVNFGDPIGTRRMKVGDRLIHLTHLGIEAAIFTLPGDTREILILTAHVHPL